MALRVFKDAAGVVWRVWSTVPVMTTGVADAYRVGWLTFESDATRRRLSPIPADWETAKESQLRAYCAQAIPGQTPVTGTRRLEERP